jgi:hypothetical protein
VRRGVACQRTGTSLGGRSDHAGAGLAPNCWPEGHSPGDCASHRFSAHV